MAKHLFIIGAMKSATTTLCSALGEHPAICLCREKEPMYYSRQENWTQGYDRYLALYGHRTDEHYLLEASTEYTKRPHREGVAERLHAIAPDARLIFIMRDPFSRIVSEYRHLVRGGLETRPLVEVLAEPGDYLSVSYYAYQLEPYFERFGRDAVFTVTYERFIREGQDVCRSLFQWLGLDDSFIPPNLTDRMNENPPVVELMNPSDLRVRLWQRLKSSGRLKSMVSPGMRNAARRLLPIRSVRVGEGEFEQQLEAARRTVQPILQLWTHELSQLLGRSFEEWQTPSVPPSADDLARALDAVVLPEPIRHRTKPVSP